MWSDNETTTDLLNYGEAVELVTDLLAREDLRPLSIGLFGGWGAGKSSLSKMVVQDLMKAEGDPYIVVEFDAWLYQDFDDARAALLEKISQALYVVAKDSETGAEKAVSLLKRVNKLRVLGLLAEGGAALFGAPTFGILSRGIEGLGDIGAGEGDGEDVEAVRRAGEDVAKKTKGLLDPEQKRSPPQEIELFRRELEELLSELDKTLVVFIDNLDRCLPRNTILTLEAVRLFLFVPGTAFVIAADEDMVRLAVAEHYKANADRLVTDYLDKLVQFPIRVPRVGVAEVRAYLIALLISQPSDTRRALSPEHLGVVVGALVENLRNTWKDGPLGLKALEEALASGTPPTPDQGQVLVEAVQIAERLAPLLATSARVGGNPRIVKRMLNTVRMRLSVAQRRQMPLNEALLAKMALFERCMGEAATNVLLTEIGNAKDGKPELLSTLEADADKETHSVELPKEWQGSSESEFVRGWIELEPKLADVDLRPVAYLTRELKPVRMSTEGLSAIGESALRTLLKAQSSNSPTVRKVREGVLPDERPLVMRGIIEHLGRVSDWKSMPSGFHGAIGLADYDADSGKDLATFIRSRNFAKNPNWLSAALKNKSWWVE
ncbi:KAP family P-loop NTPase fold protein [Palleronia pelagia]|uniref:Predicted P-loop ATPase, KAP-like n=1 Tax=Palleronia pelagia TaxID=387096 RepID=A0A1H8MET9_9RHOB|nr:P-loop NTPase fold protein [Palleronia pelagia]SEO15857.1 Predicted P-loop ATPase, KAP-like [Palleronia pelagia]